MTYTLIGAGVLIAIAVHLMKPSRDMLIGAVVLIAIAAALTKPNEDDFRQRLNDAQWKSAESGNVVGAVGMGFVTWRYADRGLYSTYSGTMLGREIAVCTGAFGSVSCT